MSSLLTTNAFAGYEQEELSLVESGTKVIDRIDYATDEAFELALNQLLNDPDIMSVAALDTREALEPELFGVDDELIQPMGMLLPYIKNVRHLGDYVQNVTLATVWASPGIEAQLTNSWTRTATFSTSTGIKAAEVSMGLNFTIGKSYTVSYSGKYTAPNWHNGKRVDHVKLYAKPIREHWGYDVYEPTGWSWSCLCNPIVKTGTGMAYKPIGVSYTKSFVYQ